MDSLSDRVSSLNQLVAQFKFLEALDRFYADDIVSVENEGPPTIGLEAYRVSAIKYLNSISNPSATLLDTLIGDDISVCHWHYRFDHQEWGHWDRTQFSVQRWMNGKIVHERHHYNINKL